MTKWAQEYIQKPLSVNTIRDAICRCQLKLYQAKRKPYVNMVQKRRRVLWAKAHLKWTVSKWESVLWSDESNLIFLLEITDAVSFGLKRRETFQRVISAQFKSQHLWWYGDAFGMGSLHVLEGTMNAERYIKVLGQHMLPPDYVYFSRTMQNHVAAITTAWLCRRARVLNWSLPAVQIFHL